MYITQLIETFTVWGMNVHPMALKMFMGWVSSKVIKNMEQFAEWRDFGRNLNMEHSIGWDIKKVTSNQKMVIALHNTL